MAVGKASPERGPLRSFHMIPRLRTTKTDWVDGRVRANLAVFHANFDDLQVEQLDDAGLSLIIANAGFCAHRWDRAGSDVAAGA